MEVVAGRFQLHEVVGQGGMARVHRATDRVLSRTVAVKEVDRREAEAAGMGQRWRHEVQLQACVRDKQNVLEIHDLIEEGGRLYLVLEYVEGGRSLSDVLTAEPAARDRLALASALSLARQAARGLRAVHEAGIVHGDIKPSNLMLTPAGTVKLADFGIASADSDESTPTLTLGTARYVAPEVFETRRTRRSDVYALGHVVYELLVGRAAIEAALPEVVGSPDPAGAWMRWHCDPDARLPPAASVCPAVPPAVSDLLQRMLDKREAARPAIGEVADVLRLAAGPAEEVTAVLPPPVSPARRRRRLILIAGGALTLLVVLAVALGMRSASLASASARGRLASQRPDLLPGWLAPGTVLADAALAADAWEKRVRSEKRLTARDRAGLLEAEAWGEALARLRAAQADGEPPVLALQSPADGSAVRLDVTDLVVAVTDPFVAGVKAGDRELRPGREGRWVLPGLPLAVEGDNRVEIVARDLAGNSGRLVAVVRRDTRPPELAGTTPAPGFEIGTGQDVELVLAFDEACQTVFAAGSELRIDASGRLATGTLAAPAAAGTWHLPWSARDAAGNEAVGSVEWTVAWPWGSATPALSAEFAVSVPDLVDDDGGRYPRRLQHERTGVELVYVPSGRFQLGSLEPEAQGDERPVREVHVTGFFLAESEVTWRQWLAGGGTGRMPPGWEDRPATGMTWKAAQAWCQANGFLLPTEAQWEYAASGPENRAFPWGDTWDGARCAAARSGGEPVAPGRFPHGASWCGALDMAGNVFEWCRDVYDPLAYERLSDGARDVMNDRFGDQVVMRGGCWESGWETCRTAARERFLPGRMLDTVGLRPVTVR